MDNGMSNDESEIIDAEIVEDENLPALVDTGPTHDGKEPIKAPNPERDWPQGPTPERRCRAHSSRTGEPCKNAAIKGATVCRFHGGSAKQVKANARARLENAADLMARKLLGIAIAGDSEAVRLAAIKDALDRAGLKAPAEVVLSQGDSKPYEEIFDDIATGTRAESRAARGITEQVDSETLGYELEADDYRSDPPPAPVDSAGWPSTPARESSPRPRDGQAGNQGATRHIQGDDALAVAAQLARQKAIESPHKRYKRP